MKRALLPLMLLCPALLQAQEATTEITAFGAYRFGGTFEEEESGAEYEVNDSQSFGLIVNFRHKDPTQWEILYSQQRTEAEFQGATPNDAEIDLELHVLQLGGTYQGGILNSLPLSPSSCRRRMISSSEKENRLPSG